MEAAIRRLLKASPASYGYRRIHALLTRHGLACNPKTVWRVMRGQGWLATGRRSRARDGRRHEGQVRVAEQNRRWASDITNIRAWNGQKGRLAIMIDCAERMVLAWRFARRITADDLAEMLRDAVFRRFGEVRAQAQGIEFLSDNRPEYTSRRFRPFVRAMGLIPFQAGLRVPGLPNDAGGSGTPAPGVDRALQPARAAQRLGAAVASRVLCRMESQKHETTCPKVSGAVQVVVPPSMLAMHTSGAVYFGTQPLKTAAPWKTLRVQRFTYPTRSSVQSDWASSSLKEPGRSLS